ncbi:hypothetical protein ILUMI_19116, partial [Ignelater luminosus]
IDNEIFMWGYRVIIPPRFCDEMLRKVHGGHNGIVRMKSLARQYLWWPGLNADIDKYVKNCEACLKYLVSPPKACLIKSNEGKHVFDRIRIDFLGPFRGKTYLIIPDAYSENNGIIHTTSAPYHPSTNGGAENSMKSFKSALSKMLSSKHYSLSMAILIGKYLFSYRNILHCVTSQTPSKLMFSRKVKIRLDFLTRPNAKEKRAKCRGGRIINLEMGEIVDQFYDDVSRYDKKSHLALEENNSILQSSTQHSGNDPKLNNKKSSSVNTETIPSESSSKVPVNNEVSVEVTHDIEKVVNVSLPEDDVTCNENIQASVSNSATNSPSINHRLRKQIKPPDCLDL